MRDTAIAQRLRNAGLKVVEVDGWLTRVSDSFDARGLVDHHTAGGRTGNAPSLNICINGRSDLPGPLCNVLIGRDGTCYVIAAGRANHAG
ncbi:MAG: peptidoglycan-binding protein, partial [Acidimicrobiales bacterium]